jgi:thymidylate synthase (FAD)
MEDGLEGGEVLLLDTFGDALTVVNAARLSFEAEHVALTPQDHNLLAYLWKNEHTSPFRHVMLRFKIKWPEFVARQAYKHVIGIEATSGSAFKDQSWSEVSRRYRPVNGLWAPTVFRKQSSTAKQGSDGVCDEETRANASAAWKTANAATLNAYAELLELGVSREQARAVLPISQFTEVVWTLSLQAAWHFIALRDAPHAQPEIAVYAQKMREVIQERFPVLFHAMSG